MKIPRDLTWLMSALFFIVSHCFAMSSGVVTGTVRDGDGKLLSGVLITLTSRQVPPSTYKTTTGPTGEYRVTGLSVGEYVVSAALFDYVAAGPIIVQVNADTATATGDLNLTPVPQRSTQNVPPSHPKLEFESSGIRGLIDPGGYSASSAGAASGLLRGIADVKRTDKNFGETAANAWPCSLEPELLQALKKNPDSVDANRRLGQFYAAHDEPSRAVPYLKRVLAADPHDGVASRGLAIAWMEGGDFESARELLTPIAATAPGQKADSEIHQLLARADEGLGQFQPAAQQYRIAASEELSEESLFGIGYELILAGQLPQGLDAFEAGVRQYPRSVPLRIGLGAVQFLEGKANEALQSFLRATDIDPAEPRPYSFLASTMGSAKGEEDQVRSRFERFLDRRPDSASAHYFYALVLSQDGSNHDDVRIENLLKQAVHLDPTLAKAHLLLADTMSERMDYESAVPEYETAIRLDQELRDAHYRLALAYKHIGKADLSVREMQIFRLSKQPKPMGEEGIDISQFISVMDARDQHSRQEVRCPAVSH